MVLVVLCEFFLCDKKKNVIVVEFFMYFYWIFGFGKILFFYGIRVCIKLVLFYGL